MTGERVSQDERGWIRHFALPNERNAYLIFTKKGARRGAETHPWPETVILLAGELRTRMEKYLDGVKWVLDYCEIAPPNKEHIIPEETAHLFEAKTDCYMVEVLEGPYEGTKKIPEMLTA